ncbi:MAG: hypothetical protein M3261_05710 [Thermoproteota archaeon]|nr:hypothetical protein [Thermoproteota archaeon]
MPPSGGIKVFSGFALGLQEVRQATGREPATGEKRNYANYGSWLGAVGYMALLDQIGSCFKPKVTPLVAGNTIEKALTYFSNLSSDERCALYALRCAFAHDYSLYNINPRNPRYTHQFAVKVGPGPVITLPTQSWDGDYSHKTTENQTVVNLEAFGDLVEDICLKIFDLANRKELTVVLPGGSDELVQRYAYWQRVAPQ